MFGAEKKVCLSRGQGGELNAGGVSLTGIAGSDAVALRNIYLTC